MRPRIVIAASMLLVAAACGGGDEPPATQEETDAPTTGAAPAPTGPIPYTTGEAEVEVSGDEDVTFTATLDENAQNVFDPEDSEAQLDFRSEEGYLLRLTLTFDEESLSDAFLAIGLGGESIDDEDYYPDAFHSQCAVTLQDFDYTSVSGTFTCTGLPSATDENRQIASNGQFSAASP